MCLGKRLRTYGRKLSGWKKSIPGLDRDQEDHTGRAMESSVLAWS